MKRFAFVVLILVAASFALADNKKPMTAKKEHKVMNPGDIQWGNAPAVFPSGAKMAVLAGNPSKAGPFTLRLKVPDGYKVAPHWHPTDENLTVISGEFNLGTGDNMDESKTMKMTAGSYGLMPAKMHHYAWTKGETEVQVHGTGPFQLIYVNPSDDPSKSKK